MNKCDYICVNKRFYKFQTYLLPVANINGTYSFEAPSVIISLLRDIIVGPKKIGKHSLNIKENTQVCALGIYA